MIELAHAQVESCAKSVLRRLSSCVRNPIPCPAIVRIDLVAVRKPDGLRRQLQQESHATVDRLYDVERERIPTIPGFILSPVLDGGPDEDRNSASELVRGICGLVGLLERLVELEALPGIDAEAPRDANRSTER